MAASIARDVVGRAVALSGPDVVDLLAENDSLRTTVRVAALTLADIAVRIPDEGLRNEICVVLATLLEAARPIPVGWGR